VKIAVSQLSGLHKNTLARERLWRGMAGDKIAWTRIVRGEPAGDKISPQDLLPHDNLDP
jgi:hypothetical protein